MATVSSLPYAHPAPPFSAPHVPREYVGSIPPSRETMTVLSEVFSVLRHDWIRQFLFTSDPIQVTVLTSLNAAYAVNVVFHESSIGRSLESTNSFGVTVDGETVLVPAFANGPYSAGVGIKKRTSDTPKDAQLMPWTGQLTSEHLRFIADTTTGSYFVVRHSRKLPFVFIEVFTLTSPTRRKRTVLTFQVAKLLDLIHRYDFKSFPYIVHNALSMVQVINEVRECNACGTVLEPQCRCAPTSVTPTHPLDFETMKRNLQSHFGSFQGAETLNLYTAGAQIASAELGARFSVALGTDPNRTRALIHWAINDRIVAECPGPLRQLTPVCNDEPEELFGYFGDLNDVEEAENVVTVQVKPGTESEPREREADVVLRSSGDSKSPSGEQLESKQGSTDLEKSSTDTPNTRSETPESGSTTGRNSNRKDTVALPVHVDPEKQTKMRIRREKNREAARRSNENKKLKNEQVRKELAESLDLMTELQAKEAALRQENSRLRKLASEQCQ